MSPRHLILLALLFVTLAGRAQLISFGVDADQQTRFLRTGEDVLLYLYEQYRNGPCKAYTFLQENTHYRNDSISGHSWWRESVELPDKFRIDFDTASTGNFVIFRNDSLYRYKEGKLVKQAYEPNTLLLLLGGMYYRDYTEVLARLAKAGFDTHTRSRQRWNKERVYVVGAGRGDLQSNQIWISRRSWRIVRIIERTEHKDIREVIVDSYQPHCRGYVETKVRFLLNGKPQQSESYQEIRPIEKFPEPLFSPGQ